MASPPFNPNEAVPGDSDVVANYPAAARTFRDIIESWMLFEHGRSGHHAFKVDTTANHAADSTWETGSVRYDSTLDVFQIMVASASWDTLSFPPGTRMLFQQTAAPPGWTKDTTHNNKALRIVSGTATTGGTVAFTDAFKSQAVQGTVGDTTLTIAQMPAHTHSMAETSGANFVSGSFGLPTGEGGGSGVTGSTGGGEAHTHGFTGTAIDLAVQYVDVIIAAKDAP